MRKFIAAVLFATILVSAGACTRVDAGYVGVKINMAGDYKGVSDVPTSVGWTFYNPVTTQVFQYPTYVQTAVWSADSGDDGKSEEMVFNSQEGMRVGTDISLSYQVEAAKVPAFYIKFRNDDLDGFTHGFLKNVARDAFNEVAPLYTVDQIYGPKKEELLTAVKTRINTQTAEFGISLVQFGVMGEMRLPQNVITAINAKLQAIQDAIKVENELRAATAEAQKKIASARGQAESNRILTESINDRLIQWRQLDNQHNTIFKWDGKLPTMLTGNTVPFLQVPTPGGK